MIPRALRRCFERVEELPDRVFTIRVSFLEIYNESLRDLLVDPTRPAGAAPARLDIVDVRKGRAVTGVHHAARRRQCGGRRGPAAGRHQTAGRGGEWHRRYCWQVLHVIVDKPSRKHTNDQQNANLPSLHIASVVHGIWRSVVVMSNKP